MHRDHQAGGRVPRTGRYKCGICSDIWEFEVGEDFPECEACYHPDSVWEQLTDDDQENDE